MCKFSVFANELLMCINYFSRFIFLFLLFDTIINKQSLDIEICKYEYFKNNNNNNNNNNTGLFSSVET